MNCWIGTHEEQINLLSLTLKHLSKAAQYSGRETEKHQGLGFSVLFHLLAIKHTLIF